MIRNIKRREYKSSCLRDPEKRKVSNKRWRDKNKKYFRDWHLKNRAARNRRYRQRYDIAYFSLLTLLGGVCVTGDDTCKGRLNIEHKFGGGVKERKDFGNPILYYNYYLSDPVLARDKLQILCGRHHRIVELERGIKTNKGVPKNDETKKKLSDAGKKRWKDGLYKRDPKTGRIIGKN